MLLARMSRTPRPSSVTGCAGSGKTMSPSSYLGTLAEAGTRVLFVCFNKALQQHLRDKGAHERCRLLHLPWPLYAQSRRPGSGSFR